jgi:FtsZ-binding cell division protein ZapB
VSSRQEELKGENAELATQNQVLQQDSEALERYGHTIS